MARGLISASWEGTTLGIKVAQRQLSGTFGTREWPGLASIFPQQLNDYLL